MVITGTPEWAARPAGGCERAEHARRARAPPRRGDGRLPASFVERRARARRARSARRCATGAPWNEPNHPFFISPAARGLRRERAVGRGRALRRADAQRSSARWTPRRATRSSCSASSPGSTSGRPKSTSIREFIADLPRDLVVLRPTVWSQHGYVGGVDPVDDVERAPAPQAAATKPSIWITETGVGAPHAGEAARTSRQPQAPGLPAPAPAAGALVRDPRVTAAFQYTFREDDLFPTGLITTELTRAYPALASGQAWGGSAAEADRPAAVTRELLAYLAAAGAAPGPSPSSRRGTRRSPAR